ncbi:MAG: hypothetical protein ACHQ52_07795 [Candidatus Eisenbacteria bacterium]
MTRQITAWTGGAALALALATLGPGFAFAQDSNYWSLAYGTRAQLLGGVVTGSPGDISSAYYNPGALALTRNTELVLGGSAYQYQRVSVEGGSGPNRTLVSSSLGTAPTLFAGEVPVLEHDRLAYAFLSRQQMNMEINARSTSGVESIAPIPNPVFAASDLHLHQDLGENWFGATWAHRLSSGLGIGVSPFLAVRSQDTQISWITEGRDAAGNGAVLDLNRNYSYLHWRLLARMGLSGTRDSLTYGVTLTTPSLGLFGSGAIHYNTSLVDQTGTLGSVMGASYQENLKSDYRSPFGADAGASYGWGSTRVHLAVDWYAAVPRYTVIDGAPFTVNTPSGDSTVTVTITDKLHAVFNWGIGLEHHFSPTLTGFASYHTDRSGRDDSEQPGASVTSWDLNDVAAGTTWHVMRSDLAFGATAAFASQPAPPLPIRPAGAGLPPTYHVNELIVTALAAWKISF